MQMNSPQIVSTPSAKRAPHSAVAPAWHTVVVLFFLLGVSLMGAHSHLSSLGRAHRRTPGYVVVMIFEWALASFIWYGVRRRSIRVRDLIGGSWPRALDVLRDLGIAIAFLIVSGIVLNGIGHFLKAKPNEAIRNLLPNGSVEIVFFLLLALTAGFCEELIFRGYLQRQFAALTGSVAGGMILQGIAFGLGHGYQGWKLMLIITIFGIMFGLLANWRRSLRPGMLAHFLQDGVGGVLSGRFMR